MTELNNSNGMTLSQDQINEILQGITIPPQPQILVDLQMEQMHPNPDLQRIADLISQDVSLAGTVLKIVNSPIFGLTNTISSIKQAVMLLGYDSLINLVNGISIKGELSDEAIVELNRFWDTAMDIAMVSASVAKQIGFNKPEEAYCLGLFHNVGIPLMQQRFQDYFSVVESSYCGDYDRIIDAENDAYRTNHAVIGYYVARSWNLSKVISESIADHHNVLSVLNNPADQDQEKATMLCILKIAEHICGNYRYLARHDVDYEWENVKDEVFAYTGLGQYDLDNMVSSFADMGIGDNQKPLI
jgi:HD-like signal output (HDOD) protein